MSQDYVAALRHMNTWHAKFWPAIAHFIRIEYEAGQLPMASEIWLQVRRQSSIGEFIIHRVQ